MSGGYGARATSDGPACLSFPTNVANSPIEQFENQTPMLVTGKSLLVDSGGAGMYRGIGAAYFIQIPVARTFDLHDSS